MSTHKKAFFFLFLFSFSFTFFALIDFGVASTPIRPTFTAEHLDVTVGDFQGPNTWGSTSQIQCYIGGEDLYSFTNLGNVNYDIENNQLLYKARAELGFEATVYSTVSPRDMDPNFNANRLTYIPYLGVDKYDGNWNSGTNYITYSVSYYEVDFEIVNTHYYSGYFPMQIGIKNTIGFGGTYELGGYVFEMPALGYDIMNVQLETFEYDHIGTWDNEYINYNPTKSGKLSIASVTEQTASYEVMNYINQHANIGWREGSNTGPFTMQNFIASGYLSRTATAGSYKLQVGLQPEVTETKRGYSLTQANIWWDYVDTWLISPAGMGFIWGPSTTYNSRRIGVNINNLMEHMTFRTYIDLYMTVEPDHILSTSELEDPFFAMGDWVWDATLFGDVPTLAEDTTVFDLLGGIFGTIGGILIFLLVIFAIGVGIYAFARIGIPALRRKYSKSKGG